MRAIIFSSAIFALSAVAANAIEYTCTLSAERQKSFVIEVKRVDLAKHTAYLSVNGGPPERAKTTLVSGAYTMNAIDNSGPLIILHFLTIHALNERSSKAIYSVHAVANTADTTVGAGKTSTGTCTSRS